MIKYQYSCPEHGVFYKYVDMSCRHHPQPCPECKENSRYRISSPLVKLEGWSGDFPSSASKWERWHEKEGKKEPK